MGALIQLGDRAIVVQAVIGQVSQPILERALADVICAEGLHTLLVVVDFNFVRLVGVDRLEELAYLLVLKALACYFVIVRHLNRVHRHPLVGLDGGYHFQDYPLGGIVEHEPGIAIYYVFDEVLGRLLPLGLVLEHWFQVKRRCF